MKSHLLVLLEVAALNRQLLYARDQRTRILIHF
jgi:hypothetical protein